MRAVGGLEVCGARAAVEAAERADLALLVRVDDAVAARAAPHCEARAQTHITHAIIHIHFRHAHPTS